MCIDKIINKTEQNFKNVSTFKKKIFVPTTVLADLELKGAV